MHPRSWSSVSISDITKSGSEGFLSIAFYLGLIWPHGPVGREERVRSAASWFSWDRIVTSLVMVRLLRRRKTTSAERPGDGQQRHVLNELNAIALELP